MAGFNYINFEKGVKILNSKIRSFYLWGHPQPSDYLAHYYFEPFDSGEQFALPPN